MKKNDREQYLLDLDDQLLQGGVILSEWCIFVVREADTAFIGGANLASILTAVSGIETYLRSEYSKTGQEHLVELISQSSIPEKLKEDLHKLRKYRNKWVHIDKPWNDSGILKNPEEIEKELEETAMLSIRALRETIYENQWI